MSSPLGQSRTRRLYICHDPPLFTLFFQHGLLLNGSAPYFSYNSMMRNVQVYRENHIIDTTGGGWLVRKYGLRPPTPPYLREGLARVNRLVPSASPCISGGITYPKRLMKSLLRMSRINDPANNRIARTTGIRQQRQYSFCYPHRQVGFRDLAITETCPSLY